VEIARRKAAEVAVIGHSDRVGSLEYNDSLSRRRAERVRNDFVERGIPTSAIHVAGRGEREPIVQTADEVSEPLNRRVEINVR
jgi:outer membrane protein OmpA-like peptidoglycan-associated protein